MTKVHVVAWHYDGGAGFDWYKAKEDADAAFEAEKKNVEASKDIDWTAYRFDFITSNDVNSATGRALVTCH